MFFARIKPKYLWNRFKIYKRSCKEEKEEKELLKQGKGEDYSVYLNRCFLHGEERRKEEMISLGLESLAFEIENLKDGQFEEWKNKICYGMNREELRDYIFKKGQEKFYRDLDFVRARVALHTAKLEEGQKRAALKFEHKRYKG